MSLWDDIFGDTDDSSQKKQVAANKKSRAFIEKQAQLARKDVLDLFPAAAENKQTGFQSALDILSQSVPEQIGAFQGGNVAAQNALLSGLPQIQNAILGSPIDLSGLQSQQLNFDPSFLNQQLPEFTRPKIAKDPSKKDPVISVPNKLAQK